MPHSVLSGTIRGHTIRDTICDGEFEPVQRMHVVAQEDTVSIVDESKD